MTGPNSAHSPNSRTSTQIERPRAAWLSEDILLLVGVPDPLAELDLNTRATVDTRTLSMSVRTLPLRSAGSDEPSRAVMVCRFSSPVAKAEPDGSGASVGPERLTMQLGATEVSFGSSEAPQATVDVRTLVREELACLEPETRNEVADFIASASASGAPGPSGLALSERLLLVREALRERLPFCVVRPDLRPGVSIDRVLEVDDRCFWLTGWVHEAKEAVNRLAAVSPEGCRRELLERAFRYPRPDVDEFYESEKKPGSAGRDPKHGFITHLQLPTPSRLQAGWMFELSGAGESAELEGPPVLRDLTTVRDAILVDLGEQPPDSDELTLNHAYPALTRIQEQLAEAAKVESIVQHGEINPSPDVSIVIPLYNRIDLIEFQLSQFVRDPEMERAEIVYVLDSPELADGLLAMSGQLYKLYRVPFKVVCLNQNAGFSRANNLGASVARSPLLLLMNSDVIPDRPGWLGKMTSFYDSTPDIGALGPKLLFEDDSLQHAGMYFHQLSLQSEGVYRYQADEPSLWENAHYFKGQHRLLPAANVTRPVPAVTGACLMIDRGLYQELGGLRGMYVQGSYEDSDLCLRLIESGRQNWYLPDVELYHLEAQSYMYPTAIRMLSTKYNMWLHTHLWRKLISSTMSAEEARLSLR